MRFFKDTPSAVGDPMTKAIKKARDKGAHYIFRSEKGQKGDRSVVAVYGEPEVIREFAAKKFRGWKRMKPYMKKVRGKKMQLVAVLYRGPKSVVGWLPRTVRKSTVAVPKKKRPGVRAGSF